MSIQFSNMNWKTVLQNVVFWLISFFVLYRLFTINSKIGKVDLYYTFLFHIPLYIVVYLNIFLTGLTIDRKKYLLYIVGFLLLLLTGIVLHNFTFGFLSDYIFPDYFMVPMSSSVQIGQYIFSYLIISLLLKLSKDWFFLKDNQLALEKENHDNQLAFLKAQLNPHFLFNSLNNIYSLVSTDYEKGREHILQLSDALRYMLYKTNDEKIELTSELEYLSNYINLEILRLESSSKINIEIPDKSFKQNIAPLILLPFIENCFKHCDKLDPEISIKIHVHQNSLDLLCKNNKHKNESKTDGGVGLTNAKKRLDLLYPNNHTLNIKEAKEYYQTNLKLNLDV